MDNKKVPKIALAIFGILFYTIITAERTELKRRVFTEAQRSELGQKPNILRVLNSNVELREEFKRQALPEHDEQDRSSRQIFAEAGIPDWLNTRDYAKDNIKHWRRRLKRQDMPKRRRPAIDIARPINEMSLEELRKRVAYIELKNKFLKELKPLEQYKNKN